MDTNTLTFAVVGMPYRPALRHGLDAFFAQAEGKRMTLRPDVENECDPMAVRAYDWQLRHVGYVAHDQLAAVWAAMRAVRRRQLHAVVVGVSAEHCRLVVEVACPPELDAEAAVLLPTPDLGGWHYDGPLLRYAEEMHRSDLLFDELSDLFDTPGTWTPADVEALGPMVEEYACCSRFDLSAEARTERLTLSRRLRHLADVLPEAPGWSSRQAREWAFRIERTSGLTGRGLVAGHDVAAYWLDYVAGGAAQPRFEGGCRRLDLDELTARLEGLPGGLMDVWRYDRGTFFARLFYLHLPRAVVREVASALAAAQLLGERAAPAGGPPEAGMPALPPELDTPEAQELWSRLRDHGFVDDRCQPRSTLTKRTAMYIAHAMSTSLWDAVRWKPFEQLWGYTRMAQEHSRMVNGDGRPPADAALIDRLLDASSLPRP